MSRLNVWFPMYPADFTVDTMNLSLEEVGAYVRILNAIWRGEGTTRSDSESMCRLLGCTAKRWQQIRERINHLLVERDGLWTSPYLDEELARAKVNHEAKRRGASARWRKRSDDASAMHMHTSGGDKGDAYAEQSTMQSICPSPSPSPSPVLECANAHLSTLTSTAGPTCPHREIIQAYHEILPELQSVLVERWGGARKTDLAARWRESPKHQTPAFWRWFFGQVRKRRFYLGENDRGWRADLGWLVKRRNFDKILEAAVSAQRGRVNP